MCLNFKICKCLDSNKQIVILHQVVGNIGETQLKVGENLNKITERDEC